LVPMTYAISWRFWSSRRTAVVAALLAVFAGPLLLMYPTIDNFAVFGVTGCGAIWLACEATRAQRAWPWFLGSGAFVGLATLARVDGLLLAVAPMTAWLVLLVRGGPRDLPRLAGMGILSLGAFALVVAPWAVRNLAEYGSMLPSAGGHTLWITDYNEQFTISSEPTPSDYLAWGIGPIVLSKLLAWGELLGRTTVLMGGVFIVGLVAGLATERRAALAPFLAYFAVMFLAMGLVFTFHAPKGAFYHSAPAWLPFAFPLAAANLDRAASAGGRFWKFLRRPATHRFLSVAGLAGAVALSLVGSTILFDQWSASRERELAAASFLSTGGRADDVILFSDPASMALTSGNPGVAGPFDGYPIQERVIRAYDVSWVVVTLPAGADIDPLGLWEGGNARDADGVRADFLEREPAFEAPGVRIYAVIPQQEPEASS
ncbi:MAG: glycosyltransferase family 39 protein, partial [Chloroflexi bacterium]|nr:glycosyltransferase family 39 protein [Chloroflexota bacterium]